MKINGLMKLTLLDFPGRTACTVFTGGCNFRCPFCHNASLVREDKEQISEDDFFSFLNKRKGVLDGVAITGGEPLLHTDIAQFIRKIKAYGFMVKLDTNGSYPERLKALCDEGLIDYVAMDIKSSTEGYVRAAGTPVPMEKITESVKYLLSDAVDYEFRTTAAKGLVEPEDFSEIAKMITGAKRYFIQGFVDSGDILGKGAGAYTEEEIKNILAVVRNTLPTAQLRGV